jgi:pectin methylesterase-like acyl-CoA thioesterase
MANLSRKSSFPAALRFETLEARDVPSTFTVDDSFAAPRPADHQYTTIQAAIDAAGKNDKVLVEAGTYTEQVVIRGSGKDGLKLVADGPDVVIKAHPEAGAPYAIILPYAASSDTSPKDWNLTVIRDFMASA